MKKTILAGVFVAMALIVGLEAFGADWSMDLSASTRGIPAAKIRTADVTTLTNGMSVAAGGYYEAGASLVYMALDAGTSTDFPSHSRGVTNTADGIEWLFCGTDRGDSTISSVVGAAGVLVCVNAGDEVHYNRHEAATTANPWTIKRTFDPSRGDWFFVPAKTTSTVSFLEL